MLPVTREVIFLLVVDAVPTIFNLPIHLVKRGKPCKPAKDRDV